MRSILESVPDKIILGLLGRMRRGRLTVELPDGRILHFGEEPQGLNARIRIRDSAFFRRCVLFGDVGFGESYELGEWHSDDVTAVVAWMILNIESNPALSGSGSKSARLGVFKALNRVAHLLRDNNLRGSRKNIAAHYDLGNEFFKLFLDETLTYSSADYEIDEWSGPVGTQGPVPRPGETELAAAQIRKYDRLCRTLRLRASDHLLEIGTGWGSFALHAARKYGCRVTTITLSEAQLSLARERIREAGLETRIDVQRRDYRDVEGRFDKIASIEMLEAVGARHLPTYFSVCDRVLKPDGLLGLQVITCPDSRFEALRKSVDWTQKRIFPGSILPSIGAIHRAVNATGDFNLYNLHDLGSSYARTLREWRTRFNANRDAVTALGMDEEFVRRWNYYFSYCEAAFQSGNITVVQMLYARPNNPWLRAG